MINVLLADDQSLIRTAVAELITHADGMTVVGQAANGREAIEQARALRPDIVLMDVRMPFLDGIEATRSIRREPALDPTRIVILTTFEEDEYVLQALQAGASGFIGKGAEAAQLMEAIRTVHDGNALLSPQATKSLIARYLESGGGPRLTPPATFAHLTDRERETLRLVGRGLSNAEIADLLYISPHTAKTHVNRVMTKLDAHDRAQLVIIAYESGLLQPGVSE